MNSSQVICIGEALIDSIFSQTGDKRINYLGGAPANVVCALSKLNIQSSFVGNIGNDLFGSKFIELFKELEIDTSFLQIDKKYKTRVVEVLRDESGDRSFLGFAKNEFELFADENLDINLIKSNINLLNNLYSESKFIITGTLGLASSISSNSIYFLLSFAKKFGLKIVIDLNWREVFWNNASNIDLTQRENQIKKIKDFLSFADILKLSKEEADMFFQNKSPLEISKLFPKSPCVVITDGGAPIKWFINGCEGIYPFSYSGNIVDTTGAGDAFLAGFLSQILYFGEPINQSEMQKALKFSTACGFLTCQGEGAIKPQPSYSKVQEFLGF